MPSDRTGQPTAEIDALTPASKAISVDPLTPFSSLFSVGAGIALFTAGNTPTGASVPVVSLAFIAAGLLFSCGAALGQHTQTEVPAGGSTDGDCTGFSIRSLPDSWEILTPEHR